INGSSTTTIEVAKGIFTARGWAILPEEGRPADRVILTYGKNNCVVAVAPVNLERADVARALKNPAYKYSGWSITLNPSGLPVGKVVLKAWAYNSTRKEAEHLNSTNSNSQHSNLFSQLKYRYAVLKVKGIRYALAKLFKKLYYK
ncbi:hypothetical protein AAHH59_10585, partial [Pediococcus acidilactici]|uniref:hypothetical protein n=1 Tax=Pediococcus acidilactici TaxID=1254 RepID=UPI00318EF473